MRGLLYYMIQVIMCSGILYGYYHFCLRNTKFHLYNRYYLLIAVIISAFIPFLNIPVYFANSTEKRSALLQTLSVIAFSNDQASQEYADSYRTAQVGTLENILGLVYGLIGMVLLIRFLMAILHIRNLLRKYVVERMAGICFINTEEPGTPFSFFKWLFWNKKIELRSDSGGQIFRHELFHIRQKHSWDIIFVEFASVLLWVNPFFHLLKREMKIVHEFLADEFATQEKDKWNYAELLLIQVFDSSHVKVANPFFHNQIKRRIAMITSSKEPQYQFLRKVMILPILTLVLILFAFKIQSDSEKTAVKWYHPITQDVTNHIEIAHPEKNGSQFFESNEMIKDTVKPGMKDQKVKEEELRKNAEKKEIESEKEQNEFRQLMTERKLEFEKTQEEFKQVMIMKQQEAEKMQEEFKQLMILKQQEAEKEQEEFKKMIDQRQVGTKEQEKFKQQMAEKQKEAEKMQDEFKRLMMKKQQEAEKTQSEFKKLMEAKLREAEKEQEEFKERMEAKQEEAAKEQEELKKIITRKEKEAEKVKKEN